MTLQKQVVPVQLGLGIDTKTDEKQLPVAFFSKLENVQMKKTGNLEKRTGGTILNNQIINARVSLDSAVALATYNDEFCLIDKRNLYSYAEQSNSWANKGPCPTSSVVISNVVSNSYEQTNLDMAYSNNTATYVWEDSRGGVYATSIDYNSGAKVVKETLLNANGFAPKAFAIETIHYIYYQVGNTLVVRTLDTQFPRTYSPPNLLALDVNATKKAYDVVRFGQRMVVAFIETSGKAKLIFVRNNGTLGGLTTGQPAPLTTVYDADLVCVFSGRSFLNQDVFWLAYYNTTDGVNMLAYFQDFTEAIPVKQMDNDTTVDVVNITGIAWFDNLNEFEKVDLYYEKEAALKRDHYILKTTYDTTNDSISPSVMFQRSAGIISKAYRSEEANRLTISYESDEFQNTYFSVSDGASAELIGWGINWGFNWGGFSATQGRAVIAAKILNGQGGGLTKINQQLSNIWFVNDTTVALVLNKASRIADSSQPALLSIANCEINHEASNLAQSVQLGGNLHIPGGYLKTYDGESVTESGYHLYPEKPTLTPDNTGGNLTAGSYSYVIVYEWIDAQGQLHSSAPSLPQSITLSAPDDTVDLVLPTLRITAKTAPIRSEITVSIYRTVANGTIYYKASDDLNPLYNDTTVDYINYQDILSDSDLLTKKILYTTGGVVENIAIDSCEFVAAHNNRIWVAGQQSSNKISYSKEFIEREGVAFNSLFTLSTDTIGPITGISSMDDKLVIFKRNEIYIVTGEGPVDTGAQNDLQVQQIASDVGCVNARSIIIMPEGVMFQSAKGIYLLTRSLQTEYIGAPVQAFNSLNITSATVVADNNQIRFATSEGIILIYDYFYQSWLTYTNLPSISTAIWKDTYMLLKPDGRCYKSSDDYQDDGSPIKCKIETAWIQLAGIQGFQRIYEMILIGNYIGSHRLRVKVAYDYQEYYTDSYIIDTEPVASSPSFGEEDFGEAPFGGDSNGVYQFRVQPSRQKCQAIKFTIEDIFPNSNINGGFDFSTINLTVGIKSTSARLSADRSLKQNS